MRLSGCVCVWTWIYVYVCQQIGLLQESSALISSPKSNHINLVWLETPGLLARPSDWINETTFSHTHTHTHTHIQLTLPVHLIKIVCIFSHKQTPTVFQKADLRHAIGSEIQCKYDKRPWKWQIGCLWWLMFNRVFLSETREDRTKRLFRHYTVGSYDNFTSYR